MIDVEADKRNVNNCLSLGRTRNGLPILRARRAMLSTHTCSNFELRTSVAGRGTADRR